jgi:signal peptidase II
MQESAHTRTITARAALPAVLWTAVVFLADRVTKLFFFSKDLTPEASPISWLVSLVHHENRGAIANIPVPQYLLIAATVIILTLVLSALQTSAQKKRTSEVAALGILLGGAFGNLFDRLIHGFVFDWILLFGQSAINLADIAVMIGTVWYAWERRERKTEPIAP